MADFSGVKEIINNMIAGIECVGKGRTMQPLHIRSHIFVEKRLLEQISLKRQIVPEILRYVLLDILCDQLIN